MYRRADVGLTSRRCECYEVHRFGNEELALNDVLAVMTRHECQPEQTRYLVPVDVVSEALRRFG